MSVRRLRNLLAVGLLSGLVLGCQAPGFMGLNGESTIPGLGLDAYTLARVPIRVMLPAELGQGRKAGDRLEVPAEGAKVFLVLDPTITAKTDAEGIAPMTIPVNGIQLIRAEVRTANGTLVLEGMMGLPFSREREQARGPNTVSLPSMRELNEPLTLSLASTLVAAHLQEHFTPEQIRYLDPVQVLEATREVSQVLKGDGSGKDFRTASLPDLTDAADVQQVASMLVERHEKVRLAFVPLLKTRVPMSLATPSATASAEPVATASADASASIVATAGSELFPLKSGLSATYVMRDAEDQEIGRITRSLTKVTPKSDGTLANGKLVQTFKGKTYQGRFLLKLQPHQLKVSMPYRPELTYPLPLRDGAEWVPATGLKAKATFVPGDETTPGSWLIAVTGELKDQPVAWSERYQSDLGLVEFTWGNDPESPVAHRVEAAE